MEGGLKSNADCPVLRYYGYVLFSISTSVKMGVARLVGCNWTGVPVPCLVAIDIT